MRQVLPRLTPARVKARLGRLWNGRSHVHARRVEHPVEYYCRTAEAYYQQLPEPQALLHKPFSSHVEAANALGKLGPLLDGLQLGKKMTVLDFGAGTCWLSRWLSLLDCRLICLDVSATALQLGEQLYRAWPSLSAPFEPPRFLLFDGRHIDLPDASVERAVCYESLHHVPNPREVLAELYRVLVPGGLAGFAEPGAHHSEHPFSQAEMQNFDVLELDVDLDEIWAMAQRVGFTDLRLRLFAFPTIELSLAEREAITHLRLPGRVTRDIRRSLTSWSIFFLYKGRPALDSRGVSGLQGDIHVVSAPTTVSSGQPFEVQVRCTNTGQATWLGPEAYQQVGSVRVGPHLYDAQMRLITFEVPRHELPRRVLPGESTLETVRLEPLAPGEYVLAFDLVAEFVTWFESLGTAPALIRLSVV